MTATIITQTVLFIFLAYLVVSAIGLLVVKFRLHKNSQIFADDQLLPSGSALRHGMVRKEHMRGVEEDSTASLNWYARLL